MNGRLQALHGRPRLKPGARLFQRPRVRYFTESLKSDGGVSSCPRESLEDGRAPAR